MTDAPTAMVQGTLDMLILKVLSVTPMHGWGITERLVRYSGDLLRVNQGSLYVALERLQRRGLITSKWDITEHNRRARYYELTRAGRRELANANKRWALASKAVNLVMSTTGDA
jgi:transcriptional regulator